MRTGFALLAVCATVATTAASMEGPVDITGRAKGAQKIVVAVVEDISPRFDVNEFGDRLIISQTWVRVSETLKGSSVNVLPVDVEGGTIGDLTLAVSDLPALHKGDRAVFFLDSTASGGNKLHGRGQGVMKLDSGDRVQGSNMMLSDVRALVRASAR